MTCEILKAQMINLLAGKTHDILNKTAQDRPSVAVSHILCIVRPFSQI